MKTWREIFWNLRHLFRSPLRTEPTPTSEIALAEEIEAMLDLMLYTATQAVAHAKRLERQLDQPQPNQELMTVQREIEHLRHCIGRLQNLLKAARSRASLSDARMAYADASQLARDVFNPREWEDLEQAVFSRND